MPVGFYNNWDNILVKLQDILRDEFGASLAVYTGLKNIHEGNQYLQISPTGSELLNYTEGREEREFSIGLTLYFKEPNIKKAGIDNVMRLSSRIETIIANNYSMQLTDESVAFNCRIESSEIEASDEEYIIQYDYKCVHVNDITSDTTAPRVTITSTDITSGASTVAYNQINLTFTLTEVVKGFRSEDVSVTNGVVALFSGTGLTRTANLIPSSAGQVSVRVAQDKFQDNADNYNTASNTFIWNYPNYSASFDGTDDHVTRSPLTLFNSSFSVAMWIKSNALGNETVLQQGANILRKNIRLGITLAGRVSFDLYGDALEAGDAGSIQADTWYHIVFTFDNSSPYERKIYRNGALLGSNNAGGAVSDTHLESDGSTPTTLYIGANRPGSSANFDGYLDEIGIWNTVLSADAIEDIYTTGASVDLTSATGDYTAQGSLKVYYKMNEGTGTVVQDSTSNDLDIDFNSGDPTWAVGRL